MFSRILVPTDFSPPSNAALAYARILAAKFGSSLQFLHVVDDSTAGSDDVSDEFAPAGEDIRTVLLESARTRLERVMNLVDRSGYEAHAHAVLGLPAASIVGYATAIDADLIVMGTHGRTGLAHLLMGSVTEQVVRSAPCPVLTVRQTAVADEQPAGVTRVPVSAAI
jgi:nucleotide-binding universal stress UspA family protein